LLAVDDGDLVEDHLMVHPVVRVVPHLRTAKRIRFELNRALLGRAKTCFSGRSTQLFRRGLSQGPLSKPEGGDVPPRGCCRFFLGYIRIWLRRDTGGNSELLARTLVASLVPIEQLKLLLLLIPHPEVRCDPPAH